MEKDIFLLLYEKKLCNSSYMKTKISERKTFSVRLKPQTMKAIRLLSVEKEKPLSDLLEEAILDLLKKHVRNTNLVIN